MNYPTFDQYDIIQRAEVILKSALLSQIDFYLKSFHYYKEVFDLLADDDSKIAYRNEVLFKILKPIMGKRVNEYLGTITESEFNKRLLSLETDPIFERTYGISSEDIRKYCIVATYRFLQYQYKDIVMVQKNDIFLDCGACFGETSAWALESGAGKVFAFEISPMNIEILESLSNDKIFIVDKAIGATEGFVDFVEGGNAGDGSVIPSSNEGISLIKLDTWCDANNVVPDFIKMDIEGSELDALKGAEKIISTYKPRMAICLYHKPEDMWTIPLYLKSIVPSYLFYCKKSHHINEFILYAIDK